MLKTKQKAARVLSALGLAAALGAAATTAQAAIIYQVDRTIGAGTLTGYIETDGTLGAIGVGNFTEWDLTLVAPDINGGLASTIKSADGNIFTIVGGSVLSATSTDLLFDHDGPSALLFAYTSSGDFWCLAGGGVGDTGCFAQGEIIGYSDTTGAAAYVEARSGMTAFASTEAAPVSAPATLGLTVAALGLLALQRRRASASA